jgi:nuclear pore complex protein Nup188
LIAILELVPVELMPDFDSLVEVWIALFGRSEPQSVAGICRQFWQVDWHIGNARRAIFDVARTRFPIQFRPLVRLLRAMTASGFLDTDPLSTTDHSEGAMDGEREICDQHVFYYLDRLPTFTQAIPSNLCTGPNALFEKAPDRYKDGTRPPGLKLTNTRPLRLPGGSVLPAKSIGRLLSGDGGDVILVAWQHEHPGWKLLLEVLTYYVNRKKPFPGSRGQGDISFSRRGKADDQPISLRLEDIGVETGADGDDALVTDALDLIRSVIRDEPVLAEQLLQSMESGDPVVAHTMTEAQPPDLVQLTAMILEEAFSRSSSQPKTAPRTNLITSAMNVLSELLALPNYSNRVWLYIRSTAILFGSDRAAGFTSNVLAAERTTGHYTMTLALLHLVQHLFYEASSSLLPAVADNPRLQAVKEEVLLRAARFVHAEIWVEHSGWKYVHLGDRFEIGRRISVLYTEILKQSPPGKNQPFCTLRRAVLEAFLAKATPSTVGPLVNVISAASPTLNTLYASRRYGDARRLIFLLESHLRLTRTLLEQWQMTPDSKGVSLLEQLLCARGPTGGMSLNGLRSQVDHIETLTSYIKERGMGSIVPLEATRVLHTLCASLASSQNTPTLVGHLTNPEATVASFVRIIQHPYDDLALRTALWNFMAMALDKEPALAGLFIHGEFRIPDVKGKGKAVTSTSKATTSALDTALDMLSHWKELWNLNPQILASVLSFIDAVWQHGMEHQSALESRRKDAGLWDSLASIAQEDLGPTPDYQSETWVAEEGIRHSPLHEAVSAHAYHTVTKSRALHIIGLDIDMHLRMRDRGDKALDKPASYQAIDRCLKDEDQLTDCVMEAAASPYDPDLYDSFTSEAKARYGQLTLRQLQNQTPLVEHEYGDDYMFSVPLLQRRLIPYRLNDEIQAQQADELERTLASINLNLSLTNAQSSLTESWQYFLRRAIPFLRGLSPSRRVILTLSASISGNIASDNRSGDMMAAIHGQRLSLLLSLLEVAWFSPTDTVDEIKQFTDLVKNLRDIVVSDAQPPMKAVIGSVPVPFHRALLQITYFCARHSRSLVKRPKALNAQQRLIFASTIDTVLIFTVDALRCVFEAARGRLDIDLDQDLELLVAVFEQCTRPDITPSATIWLARCQESDVVRCSMDLFVHTDIAGLNNPDLLRIHRRPLYSPQVLMFHLALASVPAGAEKLASEGVLVAYSNNSISSAVSSGLVDVSLPEFPAERSPAHEAYCTMLAIVSGVVGTLGRQHHFFDAEASGLVQLYGGQISRAMSWSVGDPVTVPLLEEMEQVVELFSAIADSAPHSATSGTAASKVLKAFASHALLLLQQLTYALTHPNQLASSLEAVNAEERTLIEQDTRDTSSSTLIVDPIKRPFLAQVVHRLYGLSSTILSTLLSITRAEDVLLSDEEDWPMHMALVAPVSSCDSVP